MTATAWSMTGAAALAVISYIGPGIASAQPLEDLVIGTGTAGTGSFEVNARSSPTGQTPQGSLRLDLAIGTFIGDVTCVNVDGNEATVGGRVQDGSTAAPPGSGFIFHVIDRQSAGLQDLVRLELIEAPPNACPEVDMVSPALVDSGDIAVTDAVAPTPTLATIAATVESLGLEHGLTTSLVNKLAAAAERLEHGQQRAACELLTAFTRQVDAHRGRGVPAEAATTLIDDAASVHADLGC